MKNRSYLMFVLAIWGAVPQLFADPQLTSWFTTDTGKYARLYETTADQNDGNAVTTWSRNTYIQSSPAYAGVQEVDYSSSWVYVRSTGLGFHIMGPWYFDVQKTQLFNSLPTNQKVLYRIPRTPTVPTTKTINEAGAIGCFVDGVAMYNDWDANSWNNTSNADVAGVYSLWNRDAFVNEGPSFDPSNAHQPQSGQYHYHANPPGIRWLLGDNVSYNSTSNLYTENTTPTHHSPILAWAADGFPVYGPYGYSSASNSASGIRRMTSGYALRNGSNGTDNLNSTERVTLPAWAARERNRSATLASGEYGPNVSSSYPLGRYMEDNDYLGDLGKTQGVDFDLDEYNGRWGVTPEFPGGTYAYFVCILADGTPNFPYNIGPAFYGNPDGGAVNNITETVTTNFLGGAFTPTQLSQPGLPSSGKITLTWNSVEGGTYQVESSTNLSAWTNRTTNVITQGLTTQTNVAVSASHEFYRVLLSSLAAYDPVAGSGGIASVSPTNATRGSTFTLTINLSASANPSPPPQMAPINSVTIGTNAASSSSHVSTTEVTAQFTIPAGASTGLQTVSVTFPGPPGNMSATVTYTLSNGFLIQ